MGPPAQIAHFRDLTSPMLEYYIEGVVRLGFIAAILCTFLIFGTFGQQQRRYLYVKKGESWVT